MNPWEVQGKGVESPHRWLPWVFFNGEVTLAPPRIHSPLPHPNSLGSDSGSVSLAPPCSAVTLPPSLTCTQAWEDQAGTWSLAERGVCISNEMLQK